MVPAGKDSLRLRLEIRYVASAALDSLEAFREATLPKLRFQSSELEEELTVAFVDLAEPLYKEAAERIAQRYQSLSNIQTE